MNTTRYQRQIMLSGWGESGQKKISSAKVAVIGAGGLGSPLLSYLAAAGIGSIGVIDNDRISLSNLQRQVLYTTEQEGKLKAEEAVRRLSLLNPEVKFKAITKRLDKSNIERLIGEYEMVADCTDNYATRIVLDDYTHQRKIPYFYAGVKGFFGQLSLFNAKGAGRYADLFPDISSASDNEIIGVCGSTPGVLGAMQANEILKHIIGLGETLENKLLTINLLNYEQHIFEL